MKLELNRGGAAIIVGDKVVGSIGKATGFPQPSASDESIWQGGSTWGAASYLERLTDAEDQLRQFRSWVYICINYNAKAISRQRLRMYLTKRSGAPKSLGLRLETRSIDRDQQRWLYTKAHLDGWLTKAEKVEEVIEHPYLRMMREVNPIANSGDLWMLTETYMGLTGNCYWWKQLNALGEPYQLWVLEPQYTRPIQGRTIDEYLLGYLYQHGMTREVFKPEQVVHHRYPNPLSQLLGLSPLLGISDSVLVNMLIYRYEKATFRNMARPEIMLEMEESLGDKEYRRLQRELKANQQGVENIGKPMLLEGGVKAKPVSHSPKDLAHLTGRKVTKEEIADGLGVPLALLTVESVNLANAKVAYAQYMRDTVSPKLALYEQKMNEQLVPDYDDTGRLFVAFDDCVPEDRAEKIAERESNLRTGYSTINQERAKDGEPPQEGWGDLPILPTTMAELGSEVQPGSPTEPTRPTKPGKPEEEPEDANEEEQEDEQKPEKALRALARKVAREIVAAIRKGSEE